MTTDLDLAGPTVTVFGDHDALDFALTKELGRRGCSLHAVTTPVGWLDSVTHAVIRLDSVAGRRAIEELSTHAGPAAHVVVAVCQSTDDEAEASRLDDLCRRSGVQHQVSLIWHASFDLPLGLRDQQGALPGDLALAIADRLGRSSTSSPSFTASTFDARHLRDHG